jgi:iron complex outermembrane receptor protein
MRKTFTSHLLILLLTLGPIQLLFAQSGSIQGTVFDEKQEPIPYATIQLIGTTMGATSEDDGTYLISNVAPGSYVVSVSYVGFSTFSQDVTVGSSAVTLVINLKPDYQSLSEVVVVGYGTKQVKDLTGAVTSVSSEKFLNGNITTPEQLVSGKVAGVQITSNGGAPGAGSTIRIRGGTSLNASNDPLIVIDGVPVDNVGITGAQNPLGLINPNDIENMTVLKDASAAAIYGSRAANGVIIITTKKGAKGSNKFGIEFNTNNSISVLTDQVEMLTADQLREIVDSLGNDKQKGLLGDQNTNWQDEIYRTAFSTDNLLTFGGGLDQLPYRISLGYLLQQGVLDRSVLDRYSASVNLSPSYLDDHLKVDLNFRYSRNKYNFSTQGAIGTAVTFDPTQPVYSDTTTYGGYFEWLDPITGLPSALAPKNPVGQIEQRDDLSTVDRYLGNIQLDYKLQFFPDIRANLNLGGDWSRSEGTVFVDSFAAASFTRKGVNNQYDELKNNKLLEFYLNYLKEFKNINSKIDLTAGYSYQDWLRSNPKEPFLNEGIGYGYPDINQAGDTITQAGLATKTQNTLISFYGRLNYTFMERYLLTVTLRDDGSSRFSPDTRWGLFPSAAFAWRISDENFMSNVTTISNLKLRLGYGQTGQQDIGNDYPYIANYSQGDPSAQYLFGTTYYYILRPDGYDANIKWETTTTYNAGLDFGFINGRINGSIDVYKKVTDDLLAVIPVPAGSNFTNFILTNVGSLENTGVEFTLDVIPYDTKDFTWEIGGNVTYNVNEITKLSKVEDTSSVGILTGGISGGVGNTIQIHAVGHPVSTFYVQQQLYDEDGNPLEGQYADLNGDGVITPDDRYISEHSPAPTVYGAIYTSVRYKNWSGAIQLRGSAGNWMYNNVASSQGWFNSIDGSRPYLFNLSTNYYETGFIKAQYLSDVYLEDASFIKCDNISVGYNFKNLLAKKIGLTVTGVVQNAFTITGYSGLDPEISSGIDNNIYPRPTIYSINLNIKL